MFPVIISNTTQLIGVVAIGFAIAVITIGPICILIGMRLKREAPAVRRRLVLVDKLQVDKAQLECEVSQLKQVIALHKANRMKTDALLADAMGLIKKVIE